MSPTISDDLRQRIRAASGDRCGYCRSPQYLVLGPLEIDHLTPTARGGSDAESNLWLACRMRNNYKSVQIEAPEPTSAQRVPLYNPREQQWSEHFGWSDDGTQIRGRAACVRATIIALQLNNVIAVTV